ncbi:MULTISPECIES: hypothetical protein [unclassified Clostridium]|uniref:hypothetical protein n=1 Tax=unclassified Clostridium TaxID=2614128 RepID=UPI0015F3396E|nr:MULTISPECIES: hypothetical protein [unclassified Clostridium]
MKLNENAIKDWMNRGTNVQKLIRRIMVVGIIVLIIYGLGYVVGTFIAHLGF